MERPSNRTQLEPPVYLDTQQCVRTLGEVVITFAKAPPSPAYLKAWSTEVDRVAKKHGRLINVVVIAGDASVPSDEAKKTIREAMSRHQDVLSGAVYVVEASGFLAAAMRSALSLTGLMARYPFPQKTFGDVGSAARWIETLSREGSVATTRAQVESLVETMRDDLKARN